MRLLKTALIFALFIFAIVLAVFSFKNLSPTTILEFARRTPARLQTPTQDKNLSLYETGGRFGCGIVPKSEIAACQESLGRARSFLWEHWQQKRRGYAIVEFGATDAVTDCHIFIEPDATGTWHVAWRMERVVSMNRPGSIDELPDIRSIERAQADQPFGNVATGTTILIFKDKNGNEIDRL